MTYAQFPGLNSTEAEARDGETDCVCAMAWQMNLQVPAQAEAGQRREDSERMNMRMRGTGWRYGMDGNAEFRVVNNGCSRVKMRLIPKDGSFWLECRDMDLVEEDGCCRYAGYGLRDLETSVLRKAQETAERMYEEWVEEQILYYSRFLEQVFGRTVWS